LVWIKIKNTGFGSWFIIGLVWNFHWWIRLYHHRCVGKFCVIFRLRCFEFPFHRLVLRVIFIGFSF
jgi:hypothetical protein